MCPALWGIVGRGDCIALSWRARDECVGSSATVKGQDEKYGQCGFKNDQGGGQGKSSEKR